MNADPETEIRGICYDSRKAEDGFIFVAISGFSTDGNRFIPSAVAKGAAVVICEKKPACGTPYILVSDARLALAVISDSFFGHPSGHMTVIGITGTNGKTTSSYLIKHMLEECLSAKVGLIGTNGNMIGDEFYHTERTTPESYELQSLFREMLDKGCTHVVMEVSSHSLVLSRVACVDFDAALYTNLTQDHLDFHNTMEEYAAAKRMLFSMCGRACINVDDAWSDFMAGGASGAVLTYSAVKQKADLFADSIELKADGVYFNSVYKNESVPTSLGIPGMFSVHNALGTISVGLALGIGLEDCVRAMRSAKGVKGRVEIVPTNGQYTVIIDYSHTPDSLENILQTLRPVTRGRLITVFGCGGDRDHGKRPIMGAIAAKYSDLAIVTSDNPRTEEPMRIIEDILPGMSGCSKPYVVECDRIRAIKYAVDNAEPGDVILLAGKGHEDYQEIGHTKIHMDEREIVADILSGKIK